MRVASGQSRGHQARLPRGNALVVHAQHLAPLREHVRVHQPPPVGSEARRPASGSAPLTSSRSPGSAGKSLCSSSRRLVGVAEDVLRLAEDPLVGHEHRRGLTAAGPPRHQDADPLHMAFLDVVEAGALERPARLLAVVADRDGDQAPHRRIIAYWPGLGTRVLLRSRRARSTSVTSGVSGLGMTASACSVAPVYRDSVNKHSCGPPEANGRRTRVTGEHSTAPTRHSDAPARSAGAGTCALAPGAEVHRVGGAARAGIGLGVPLKIPRPAAWKRGLRMFAAVHRARHPEAHLVRRRRAPRQAVADVLPDEPGSAARM